jgi:small subunit ribosomal protein S5
MDVSKRSQKVREKEDWNSNMRRNYRLQQGQDQQYRDQVILVNRTSKKTTGGNKIGFAVMVVVGDGTGKVGAGLGKALDVMSALRKGTSYAKKHFIDVPLFEERTIPRRIEVKYGAANILLKPAPKGSGIIAGGAVRTVLELAGVKDVVGKMLGSRNKITNVYATLEALRKLGESRRPTNGGK